jgi:hypothetical protein
MPTHSLTFDDLDDLDDLHALVPASIVDILPTPAMAVPPNVLAGFRPAVCLLPDRGRPEVSRFSLSTGNAQAKNSRSHPRMSVKRNLFSDRARWIAARN